MVDRDKNSLLVCKVRARTCALPLSQVREVMRPLPISVLAGAPAYMLGMAVIRGAPTPILDLGRLLGEPSTSTDRFIIVKGTQGPLALGVQAVLGVHRVAPDTMQEMPSLLRDVDHDLVASIGVRDAELLLVLDSARLMNESDWPMAEAPT